MKRWTAVTVGAAAVVMIGGGLIAWSLLSRSGGPGETVGAYLAALERGDGAAASALSARPAADVLAVDYDALGGATEWISAPRTDAVAERGTDATATATFTLAGEQHSVTFTLSKQTGTWLVTSPPAAPLQATSTLGAGIEVGDIVVPFDAAATASGGSTSTSTSTSTAAARPQAATVVLPPGVYDVAAAPSGLLEGSQEVVVAGPAPLHVALQPTLGAAATAAADAGLTTYLAACTVQASAVPTHCGIRVPWAADLASLTQLTFRIDAAPSLVLAVDSGGFAATDGTLVATATGVDDSGAEASFTYRDSEWALRGSMGFTTDTLTLEMW